MRKMRCGDQINGRADWVVCGLDSIPGCSLPSSPCYFEIRMSTSNIPKVTIPQNLLEFAARGDIRGVEEESFKGDSVDPNMTDADGNTPLILAAQAGYTQIVEFLLERFPVNIDQTNKLGQTALMKSAIQGRISCARTLLRAGADPNKKDTARGFCAFEWAQYVGRTECQHMIAHYAFKPTSSTKRKKKTSVVKKCDLQKLTAIATVPLLGDSADSVVPRPRLHSAPIPKFEITSPTDVLRKFSYGHAQRPKSSMA